MGGGPGLPEGDSAVGRLEEEDRHRIAEEVMTSAYQIMAGKGATNYAIALAVTRIIEAVPDDERRVLPVSSLLRDSFGISDVCLSVPSVVGRGGVAARLGWRCPPTSSRRSNGPPQRSGTSHAA